MFTNEKKLYLQQPYKLLKQDWIKHGGMNQWSGHRRRYWPTSRNYRWWWWWNFDTLRYVVVDGTM